MVPLTALLKQKQSNIFEIYFSLSLENSNHVRFSFQTDQVYRLMGVTSKRRFWSRFLLGKVPCLTARRKKRHVTF